MELEFISRVIKVSLVLAVILLSFVGLYFGWNWGIAIFAGTLWACVNLYFLRHLIVAWITPQEKDYIKIWTLLGIKFPLLYLGGLGLLMLDYLPTLGLALGFTTILVVIFLKGLGRLYLERGEAVRQPK